MPGALTHTRITWALSLMASQVLGVTPGSPCAHGILGTPHREVCDNSNGFPIPNNQQLAFCLCVIVSGVTSFL